MSQQTPPAPASSIDAYFVFCGNIDQDATKRIMTVLTAATNLSNRIGHAHLLFQSLGGSVGDAVCLYNFLRSFPLDLTIYNVGSVQSAAVLVYLGAKRRYTSAHATFMIHRPATILQSTTAQGLQVLAKSAALDDARVESILRSHITLTDADWTRLDTQNFWFSSEEAVRNGTADKIAEFAPPKGTQLFNV